MSDNDQILRVISQPHLTPSSTTSSSSCQCNEFTVTSAIERDRAPILKSILASDGQSFFRLSAEFQANVDRLDRHELRKSTRTSEFMDFKFMKAESTESEFQFKRSFSRIKRTKLVRQPLSIRSNDSAFTEDTMDNSDDESLKSSTNMTKSTESVDRTSPNFLDSRLNKLRSASIDSGYLDTVSSTSSHNYSEDDHLTVVDEDELVEHCLSENDFLPEKELLFLIASLFSGGDVYLANPTIRNAKKLFENVKYLITM